MDEIWDKTRLFKTIRKGVISIRLDESVLDFFRDTGNGYQTRMNEVLKSFVAYQKKKQVLIDNDKVYTVFGGDKISGEIEVGGSPITATYIISASILSDKKINLENIPNVKSLDSMSHLLEKVGIDFNWNKASGNATVLVENLKKEIDIETEKNEYFSGMILTTTALLSRGRVINFKSNIAEFTELQYFSNFLEIGRLFGLKDKMNEGVLSLKLSNKRENLEIDLSKYKETPKSTLTATAILFAVKHNGSTVIKNGSFSPSTIDLCDFLKKTGVKIKGVGSSVLEITGGTILKETTYPTTPDYLGAYFYITIAVATRGKLKLKNINIDYLDPFLFMISEFGVIIKRGKNEVSIDAETKKLSLPKTTFSVGNYPNYPAYNALMLGVLLSTFDKETIVEGFIYLSPWSSINELRKFGLQMEIDRERLQLSVKPSKIILAETELKNTNFNASILLASILAKGKSSIKNGSKLNFFHEHFERKLQNCGINIKELKNEND
ncbi:MAG: BrnA antitoxin family protein [Alphaproteobacteria bacterium]